jgi:hypothetical protein
MKLPYLALALLFLGCIEAPATGLIIDGMTQEPISGLRIVARAQEPTGMTCQVMESTSDDQGVYVFKKACSGIPYSLESGDKTFFLAGAPRFVGGEPSETPLSISAWRSPPGNGVYVLRGSEILAMRQAAKVTELTLWKSTEKVQYPETIPDRLPAISADDFLIIAGAKHIKRLVLHPLIKHAEKLRFGSRNYYSDMDPWSYIGRRFVSKDKHEAVAAQLDESKVINILEDKRALRYIPGNALPNGTYALLAPGDSRVYLMEFK